MQPASVPAHLGQAWLDYFARIGINVPPNVVEEQEKELREMLQSYDSQMKNYGGYPNLILGNLLPEGFFSQLWLNIGDHRGNNYAAPNTCDVVDRAMKILKELFCFPSGVDDWGGITTGSTQGVYEAIRYAKKKFRAGGSLLDPVVISSEQAHYCVKKNAENLDLVYLTVSSNEHDDAMNIGELRTILGAVGKRPVIVVGGCGHTETEPYDDFEAIKAALDEHPADTWLHADAALCAIPCLSADEIPKGRKPLFNHVGSLSISLNKFTGMTVPGGIVLGIQQEQLAYGETVAYIESKDTMSAGSQSGLPILHFVVLFELIGAEGLAKMAMYSRRLAKYLAEKLRTAGVEVFHNPGALTVLFKKPSQEICTRYTLAPDAKGRVHFITMGHWTEEKIDRFVKEYLAWRATASA